MSAVVLVVTGAWTYGWRRHRQLRARIAQDESVRNELEAQLRHAQKMDAVGRLAAGLVHDFNNLITVIIASSDEGLSTPGIQDEVRARFEDVRSAGDSAAALTKQLLTFSRRPIVRPRMININEVVTDTVRLIELIIIGNIGLQLRRDPQLGHIVADAGQIQQVLVNLAVNARDAMPDGGELVIETRNVSIGHEELTSHPQMHPGHYVLLVISDTGIGMDAGVIAQIFEPFFTTKGGDGTGLGLSTVYGIVKQSGGFIWPYSEVGRGSTFKIYFPRVDDSHVVANMCTVP
jgi:two-component system cell cycle sensor histidine kinase/response regulator CckA